MSRFLKGNAVVNIVLALIVAAITAADVTSGGVGVAKLTAWAFVWGCLVGSILITRGPK